MTKPDHTWPPPPTAPVPVPGVRWRPTVFIAGFVASLLAFILTNYLFGLFDGPGAMADRSPLVVAPVLIATVWCLADMRRGLREDRHVSTALAVVGILLNAYALWLSLGARLK